MASRRRGWLGGGGVFVVMVVVSMLVVVTPGIANVASADELDRCVDAIREGVAADGGEVVAEGALFLLPKKTAGVDPVPGESGCLSFLAFGGARTRDVDLYLYQESGVKIQEDRRRASHAYLQHCGAAGEALHPVLKLADGIGEVRWVAFRGGLRESAIRRLLEGCGPEAERQDAAPARPDVGRLPQTSLVENFERMRRDLLEQGFAAMREPTTFALRRDAAKEEFLFVRRGSCYAVLLAGGGTGYDLDVAVVRGSDTEIVRDVSSARDASVAFCAIENNVYRVIARSQRGQGKAILALYSMTPPTVGAEAMKGHAALSLERVRRRLEQRGFVARHSGWVWAPARLAVNRSVKVESGRCYAFAVVAADPVLVPGVTLSLLDDEGTLVARDVRRGAAWAYHCASWSGVVRLRTTLGRSGRARFVVGIRPEERGR